jgi:glucosamine 6-phosphate synthetase-like amidotransferase/phosphosugar isomerase protein
LSWTYSGENETLCGLVGIAGDTFGVWKDVFSELLLIDSVRGTHSTGAGFIGRDNESFQVAKEVGDPFNLFLHPDYDDFLKNPSKVIMGHNRYATMGAKLAKNAHPFMFSDVIGMHNGTLDKWCITDLKDSDKFETDSEAIFYTINQDNIQDTIKHMTGAWALVWFDKRTHNLHFLRNDKRPLHYCYSDDHKTLIWASEQPMLEYVMSRRQKKVNKNEYFTTAKDTLYSWYIPDDFKVIEQPTLDKMEGKKFNSFTVRSGVNGKTKLNTSVVSLSSYFKTDLPMFHERFDTKKFRPPYKDTKGNHIGKKQFFEMVHEGCSFCDCDEVSWGKFVFIMGKFQTPKTTPFMCEDCFNEYETYQFATYVV